MLGSIFCTQISVMCNGIKVTTEYCSATAYVTEVNDVQDLTTMD